ncbi:hypothetical protein ABTK11_20380, partial [Acinetobacter baumannii]
FSSISPVGETAQGTPLRDQEVVRLHHNLVVGLGASLPLNRRRKLGSSRNLPRFLATLPL